MSEKQRIIHTGLFSKNAKYLLQGLFNYIDDNKPRRVAVTARRCKIIMKPDNEVILQCKLSDRYSYSRSEMIYSIWDRNPGNDQKPREWIAVMLKKHVIEQCGSDGVWRRDNDAREVPELEIKNEQGLTVFSPTVAEAYYVYDALLNRKKIEKRFSEATIKRMHGIQKDPIATEMEIARREEVKRLKAETEQKLRDLEDEKLNKISAYRQQLDLEYKILKDKVRMKLEEDLANLEKIANMGACV